MDGALEHGLTSAEIHPGADDSWYDGIDQNCDGLDDFDKDGDGYVPDEYEGVQTEGLDSTGELQAGDCDDDQPTISPSAIEYPVDGLDSNCDGKELCFEDLDFDGVGTQQLVLGDIQCSDAGASNLPTDCDDDNALNSPEFTEQCDGLDNDCDGDPGIEEVDSDQDGYVTCSWSTQWSGDDSVIGGDDCDDSDPTQFPGQTWYFDADGDGYGQETHESHVIQSCSPNGFHTALVSGDCIPGNPEIYPNAPEDGDWTDNNCDSMEADGYMCSGNRIGDAYFLMCPIPISATAARDVCTQYGYDGMASIVDPYENLLMVNLNEFLNNGIWIGASDNRVENQFSWDDDSPFNFSRWASGHPNILGLTANCVVMNDVGDWLEVPCNQALTGFSCSRRW